MSTKAISKPSQTANAIQPAEPAVGTTMTQLVSMIASTAPMVLSFTTYGKTEPEDAEYQDQRLATKMWAMRLQSKAACAMNHVELAVPALTPLILVCTPPMIITPMIITSRYGQI